ncbi:MAG: hypothetical protein P4L57_03985, partial [Rhizomicrobium sp.]|nr:hypothetical protein [Rhizomicrobium sp.]
ALWNRENAPRNRKIPGLYPPQPCKIEYLPAHGKIKRGNTFRVFNGRLCAIAAHKRLYLAG